MASPTIAADTESVKRTKRWIEAIEPEITAGIQAKEFDAERAAGWLKLLHPAVRLDTHKTYALNCDIRSTEFWRKEVDTSLYGAVISEGEIRKTVLARTTKIWPRLDAELLREHIEDLAATSLPSWLKSSFWTKPLPAGKFIVGPHGQSFRTLDQALKNGIAGGALGEKSAVNAVSRAVEETRALSATVSVPTRGVTLETVWARLRYLRGLHRGTGEKKSRFRWTAHLKQRMQRVFGERGLKEAISEVQNETGLPYNSIRCQAFKLRLRETPKRKPWKDSDLAFLFHHVEHGTPKYMAEQLNRTEKAVRRKLESLGLSGKLNDGYTVVELCSAVQVSKSKLRSWIARGLLKRGENRRITEDSLTSFFRKHRELLLWETLPEPTRAWIAGFLEKPRAVDRPAVAERETSANL